MRPFTISLTPSAASATLIATSQSPGAGTITLTAAAANIDSGTNGRIVGITSGSDDHLITFTITGVDNNGNAASETLTGSAGAPGTVVSTKFYKSISSVTHTGSVAGTVTIGTVGTTLSASSNLIPLNFYARIATQVAVEITGTINFTVQETFDPILASGTSGAVLFSVAALTAKSANTVSQIDVAATGIQIIINSYSTGATLTARVIEPSNSNKG